MYYNNVLRCIRSNISYDDFNRPRKIVPFYKDGKLDFYGIQYTDSKDKKYYYSPEGNLLKYEINTSDGTYPYKTISYDTNGRILTINLAVSENEAYVFYKNKKLIGHWLNDKCYNENGKVDLTRTIGK